MRIGLFTDRYLPQTDGVSVAVEIMREELTRLGHDVYIVAPRPSWRYKEHSPNIIRLPALKGLFGMDENYFMTFYFPPQMLRRIDGLDLDIIHFQTPGQVGFLGANYATRTGLPLVSTYHTDILAYLNHYASSATLPGVVALASVAPAMFRGRIEEYWESFSSMRPNRSLLDWHRNVTNSTLRLMNNHCDLVIAPSKKMMKQLEGLRTTTRIVTLPTGIDKIQTSPGEVRRWREKLGLSPSDKIVLFVGRMGSEKNIDLLISAFDIVAGKDENAKLLLVGPGDDDDVAANTAQAAATAHHERILFVGSVPRPQLGALYELADVLGFPSLTDTQGLAVNEAVAAGLPVVMIDKEINGAVVNGQNGYIVRRSAREMATKLLKILSNEKLRERFSKRSVELAKDFTADKQTKELAKLYEQTIRRHEAGTRRSAAARAGNSA